MDQYIGKLLKAAFTLILSVSIVATCAGCKNKEPNSASTGLTAEEILEACEESLADVSSFHRKIENWLSGTALDNKEELVGDMDVFVIMPDRQYTIYHIYQEKDPDLGDVIELWEFGERRIKKYSSGEIVESDVGESHAIPEFLMFDYLWEPVVVAEENVEGRDCYAVAVKFASISGDLEGGYTNLSLYIDKADFLLRKMIMETLPERRPGYPVDESMKKWSVSIYDRYNEDFEIFPP